MKTVFWRVVKVIPGGSMKIEYWTKPDRSNALHFTTKTASDSMLRKVIEIQTGLKHFELKQVKDAV